MAEQLKMEMLILNLTILEEFIRDEIKRMEELRQSKKATFATFLMVKSFREFLSRSSLKLTAKVDEFYKLMVQLVSRNNGRTPYTLKQDHLAIYKKNLRLLVEMENWVCRADTYLQVMEVDKKEEIARADSQAKWQNEISAKLSIKNLK